MEDKFEEFDRKFLNSKFTYEILNEEKINDIKKDSSFIPRGCNATEASTIIYDNTKKSAIEVYRRDVNKEDIIPTMVKFIYSLPSFGKMSCLVLLNIHALLYYESIGASLLYMSFFVSLARACEIILKPLIAHMSDQTESKLGRRKPYMLFGCIFYAIFLILLFSPPSMRTGATYISIWFGMFYVLFFIADTVTNVPYLALGPELSSDSKEREKLYIWFYMFQYIGVLFAAAAPVLLNRLAPPCVCDFCSNNPMVTNLDECLKQCQIFCNLKNNRNSLFYMSLFIGVFFVVTILLLGFTIRENKSSFNKEPMHFLPSLYRLLSNKPFAKLIVPWIIDVMISTIFSTMLPFFLNFVINPQKYCIKMGIDLSSESCSVNVWLGYSMSVFFVCCILSMLVWHYLVQIFGKKRCWEIYSLIAVLTFSLFLMCDEGSMGTLIFASICCSIPAGGAYLNDVFVADVIEYDEFFTGKRNEGLYTVFAAFIPKVVSIFAQVIPMTIMSFLGFVSSSNGYANEQPTVVIEFIRFFFIAVPCILALASFFFKLRYPINSDDTLDEIRKAIILQKDFSEYLRTKCDYYKIMDPIYNKYHMQIFVNNEPQRDTKIVVDHFSDLEYLKMLYEMDYLLLKAQVKFNIIGSVILVIVFLITLISTFPFLEFKSLSLIPLFSLFIISTAIVLLIINIIRFNVINKVLKGEYKIDMKFLKLLILKVILDAEEQEGEEDEVEKVIIESKLFSINENTSMLDKFLANNKETLLSPPPEDAVYDYNEKR